MVKDTLNKNILYNGDSALLLSDPKKFPDESVNLIVTSPPYADKRKKTYKGVHSDKYVEWFLPIAEQLKAAQREAQEQRAPDASKKKAPDRGDR